jgi:hypothetical protein
MFRAVSCSYVKNTRNNDVVVVYDQARFSTQLQRLLVDGLACIIALQVHILQDLPSENCSLRGNRSSICYRKRDLVTVVRNTELP